MQPEWLLDKEKAYIKAHTGLYSGVSPGEAQGFDTGAAIALVAGLPFLKADSDLGDGGQAFIEVLGQGFQEGVRLPLCDLQYLFKQAVVLWRREHGEFQSGE
jgi:hypothetical protein